MKRCYEALGKRFQYIEVQKESGDILWDICAPWLITEQKEAYVKLLLKGWALSEPEDKEVEVTGKELIDDAGPFKLILPFSLAQASLVSESTGEVYLLSGMVPNLKRRLGKRPSDTEGATNTMNKSAGQAKQEKLDSQKAKTSPAGVLEIAEAKGRAKKAAKGAPRQALASRGPVAAVAKKASLQSKANGAAEPKATPKTDDDSEPEPPSED